MVAGNWSQRPSVPSTESSVLYRATFAHHETRIIFLELNSVSKITTSSSTVYVTDKSHTLSWNTILGDVLNTYMYMLKLFSAERAIILV